MRTAGARWPALSLCRRPCRWLLAASSLGAVCAGNKVCMAMPSDHVERLKSFIQRALSFFFLFLIVNFSFLFPQ